MKFYNIFFLFSFLFCLNFEVRGQTQVIPSLEASASNLATAGAIPYVSAPGVLNINAANLFWDNTNARLGIGTNAPGYQLDMSSASNLTFRSISSTFNDFTLQGSGVRQVYNRTNAGANNGMTFQSAGTAKWSMDIVDTSRDANEGLAFSKAGLGAALTNSVVYLTRTGGVGLGLANVTPTGISVLDATPSTGATATWIGHDGSGTYSGVHLSALTTSLKVVAGTVQGATNLQEWQGPTGTVLANISSAGVASVAQILVAAKQNLNIASLALASDVPVTFQSGSSIFAGSADTSLSRIGAGIVGFGLGTAGTITGAAAMNTLGVGVTPTNTANVSHVVVKAGSSQSTTNLQEWQNNAGTAQTATFSGAIGTVFKTTFGISYFGDGNLASEAKNSPAIMIAAGSTEIRFRSTGILSFSNSATDAGVSADTSLSRISAGVVGVGTGAAGSVAGAVQATKYISAGTAFITWGTGTPEAAVTATVGSVFLRTDGGANTTLYVKESGSGNTGWIAK